MAKFSFLLIAFFSTNVFAKSAIRGSFLHFVSSPFSTQPVESSYQFIEDGLLIVGDDGKVITLAKYKDTLLEEYQISATEFHHYPGSIITPGFVDTHFHYAQAEMMGAFGEDLLNWLAKYTFQVEMKYANKTYAKQKAGEVLDRLIKNGTTTALVFATVYPSSTDAFFEEADARHMRMIAGKVMMDNGGDGFVPAKLLDTPESSYLDSENLIKKWHGHNRLLYAITPRFALTSTDEQLRLAGELRQKYPDVYVHTHLSENVVEVGIVKERFKKSYLKVYQDYGLIGRRSIMAHGIYLEPDEFEIINATETSIAFCPTSNLFLGSGLFPLFNVIDKAPMARVGMGTDVGAGTSFSMLETMNEAYKVQKLQGQKLSAFQALYLATKGGAHALDLDDKIGDFQPGKEADFVVLNPNSPDLSWRTQFDQDLHSLLFTLITIGDDRAVQATYVLGKPAFERN